MVRYWGYSLLVRARVRLGGRVGRLALARQGGALTKSESAAWVSWSSAALRMFASGEGSVRLAVAERASADTYQAKASPPTPG